MLRVRQIFWKQFIILPEVKLIGLLGINSLKIGDAPYFIVKGILQNKLGQKEIEIRYREDRPSSKEIRINGVTIRKTSELFGQLTAVLFAPEDLSMIKGAPAERRRLLDYDISQVSPIYYSKLQKHNRLLNQRNYLLKRHWESGGN